MIPPLPKIPGGSQHDRFRRFAPAILSAKKSETPPPPERLAGCGSIGISKGFRNTKSAGRDGTTEIYIRTSARDQKTSREWRNTEDDRA
jgi:hypothetical protein